MKRDEFLGLIMIERDLVIARAGSGTKLRHQAIGALDALQNIATRAGELSGGEEIGRDIEMFKHHNWRQKLRALHARERKAT